MFLNLKFSFLFIVSLLSIPLFSQLQNVGTSHVTNYHRSDYQAGSQIWDVQQGNNGMMYFANNDGLIEFDGVFWNTYPLPNKSVVRCINIDNEGNIYSGGFNEFGYFKKDNSNSLQFHSLTDLLPEDYKKFDEVWKIVLHPDGIIFQSYNQLMILKDSLFTIIPAPKRFHFSFFVNNEYYVNDIEKGLMRYAMGKLFPLNGIDDLKGKEVCGVLEHENQLLISNSSAGIFIYDGNSLKKWNENINRFLIESQIYCSFKTSKGYLVFGTIQNGLLICSENGIPLQHLSMNDGLQNNTILSIEEDFHGNLWLGTDHGIDYVEINSPLSCISNNYGINTGYTAIADQNFLYLGTNQGLFYKDFSSNKFFDFKNKEFDFVRKTGGQVWSLNRIKNTIFCGHNKGTFIINGKNAKQISDISGGWMHLQVPNNPNLVIGGSYSGLSLFRNVNGEWEFSKQYSGFSESARSMVFDKDGSLWMTHGYNGIYHFYFSDDYEEILDIKFYNLENSKLSDQLFGLGRIDDRIVFLTGLGVLQYSENLDDFISYNFFDPFLENDVIRAIKTDKYKNIWYFTSDNTAVLRLGEDNRYTNVTLPFKQLEGGFVNSFEFIYPYNEKIVFIATVNGFEHYKADFHKKYNFPYNLYLKKVLSNNIDITRFLKDSTNNFKLDHFNNQLEFIFSSNDFVSPSRMMYSTYLNGYETKWSAWNTKNTKEYTNLDEGDYVFNVKAKNIYGKISKTQSIAFSISPPFHRSIYAIIIYIVLLFLFIIIVLYIIKKRIDKVKFIQKQQQKELFKKRENQLKREALETEKEIIRLRNQQLKNGIKEKDKELANSTFETIHMNEILTNLRDELKILATSVVTENNQHQLRKIIRKVNSEINSDKKWEVFESHFESVHEEFLKRIKNTYPSLTPRELKLCAYLRMNISSKEISLLMNISLRGVEISRYRLRKKLSLDRKVNLTDFILSF